MKKLNLIVCIALSLGIVNIEATNKQPKKTNGSSSSKKTQPTVTKQHNQSAIQQPVKNSNQVQNLPSKGSQEKIIPYKVIGCEQSNTNNTHTNSGNNENRQSASIYQSSKLLNSLQNPAITKWFFEYDKHIDLESGKTTFMTQMMEHTPSLYTETFFCNDQKTQCSFDGKQISYEGYHRNEHTHATKRSSFEKQYSTDKSVETVEWTTQGNELYEISKINEALCCDGSEYFIHQTRNYDPHPTTCNRIAIGSFYIYTKDSFFVQIAPQYAPPCKTKEALAKQQLKREEAETQDVLEDRFNALKKAFDLVRKQAEQKKLEYLKYVTL